MAGARPRTLPAAVVPVLVGTAAAAPSFHPARALAAMVVSLAIQIGTNYANDYSDGVRGTDKARTGPTRLVASGLASPAQVKHAAVASFGVAAMVGSALSLAVDWRLMLAGGASIVAGWAYTGGKRPYGYSGLGEIFVFVFFGIVAVTLSTYVQLGHFNLVSVCASVPVGLLAVSMLVVNNLRDIQGDYEAAKMTLAVRLGEAPTRILYLSCIALPLAAAVAISALRPWALVALAAAPLAWRPYRAMRAEVRGRQLVAVLADTGRYQLAYGALLALGLALHA